MKLISGNKVQHKLSENLKKNIIEKKKVLNWYRQTFLLKIRMLGLMYTFMYKKTYVYLDSQACSQVNVGTTENWQYKIIDHLFKISLSGFSVSVCNDSCITVLEDNSLESMTVAF